MKPLPAPSVPGSTDAERMSNALSMVLTVPTAALLKKEARIKRANDKKRAKKTARFDETLRAAVDGLNAGVKANSRLIDFGREALRSPCGMSCQLYCCPLLGRTTERRRGPVIYFL